MIEILKAPPVSGGYKEFKFDAVGDCTWVKFSSEHGVVVGIFGNAGLPESSVTLFNDDKHVLVLASGQGYILELASMKLTYKTEINYLSHAKAILNTDLIAVGDFFSVYMFAPAGLVWAAERIAKDDLKIKKATSKLISGTFWTGTQISDFSLDITSIVKLLEH